MGIYEITKEYHFVGCQNEYSFVFQDTAEILTASASHWGASLS